MTVPYHFPLILGAALLTELDSPVRDDRPPEMPGTWVWPVPRFKSNIDPMSLGSYDPVMSQEYRASDHHGIDVMFQRKSADDRLEFVAGTHDASRGFFAPPGVPILAPHDALVWSCDKHPLGRGWQIVLDMGKPYAFYMLHMSEVYVQTTQRGESKERVTAGQVIGLMGYDPIDPQGLRHLHFECWYNGGADAHINPMAGPAPMGGMPNWTIIDDPRG